PVTVPVPLPLFSTRTPVTPRNRAVVLVLVVSVKSQVAFVRPLQGPPDQFRNRLPAAAVATSTTRVPACRSAVQSPVPSKSQGPCGPSMAPTPFWPTAPAGVATARLSRTAPENVALTLTSPVIATVQTPVPVQASPQALKRRNGAASGISVTTV